MSKFQPNICNRSPDMTTHLLSASISGESSRSSLPAFFSSHSLIIDPQIEEVFFFLSGNLPVKHDRDTRRSAKQLGELQIFTLYLLCLLQFTHSQATSVYLLAVASLDFLTSFPADQSDPNVPPTCGPVQSDS